MRGSLIMDLINELSELYHIISDEFNNAILCLVLA